MLDARSVHRKVTRKIFESSFDRHAILLAVVGRDDFLIVRLEIRASRIFGEHSREPFLHRVHQVQCVGALCWSSLEFRAEPVKIDGGNIELLPRRCLPVAPRHDRLIDDIMQFAHDTRDIGRFPIVLQTLVDIVDRTDLSAEIVYRLHRQAGLEFRKHLACQDFKPLAAFVIDFSNVFHCLYPIQLSLAALIIRQPLFLW